MGFGLILSFSSLVVPQLPGVLSAHLSVMDVKRIRSTNPAVRFVFPKDPGVSGGAGFSSRCQNQHLQPRHGTPVSSPCRFQFNALVLTNTIWGAPLTFF